MSKIIKSHELKHTPIPIEQVDDSLLNLLNAQLVKQRFVEDAKDDVIELCLNLTQKIVNHVVEVNPALLNSFYQSALEEAKDLKQGIITVHSKHTVGSDFEQFAHRSGFEVVEDARLKTTECIIKAKDGCIESSVEKASTLLKVAFEKASHAKCPFCIDD